MQRDNLAALAAEVGGRVVHQQPPRHSEPRHPSGPHVRRISRPGAASDARMRLASQPARQRFVGVCQRALRNALYDQLVIRRGMTSIPL